MIMNDYECIEKALISFKNIAFLSLFSLYFFYSFISYKWDEKKIQPKNILVVSKKRKILYFGCHRSYY